MNTTELTELLDSMELIGRRKRIIIALFPDKILSQSQLAEETGIALSNLGRYLNELQEKNIVEITQGLNEKGFSAKLVQLTPRFQGIFSKASEPLVFQNRHLLKDLDNFKKIMERLLNPSVQVHAADSIQILSQRYIIPFESGFFSFLKDHLNNKQIRPVLVALLKSARNILRDLNPENKKKILTLLGSKLHDFAKVIKSEALKYESFYLLEELGAYNIPYQELKAMYLEQRYTNDSTDMFRSLLLKDHKDNLMDLWISMLDLYEQASESEKRWLDQEFTQLR